MAEKGRNRQTLRKRENYTNGGKKGRIEDLVEKGRNRRLGGKMKELTDSEKKEGLDG